MNKMNVVICVSGWLGEIALKAAMKISYINIILIMTDRASLQIQQLAQLRGLSVFFGNPRDKKPNIKGPCDVIAAINYLFIIPPDVLKKAKRIAFNIHDSLLPKYMGRTPVTWVIINDEVETGITVHEMASEVDAGDIIVQRKVPITNLDTGGDLLKKMGRRYPAVLRQVFRMIRLNKIQRTPQDLQKRSYCGKREPSDGLIDWRWSSRKVYNWVRAQTRPYPGAFGFIGKRKYRIWKVEECARISRGERDIVPCGQGAVRLIDYEIEE